MFAYFKEYHGNHQSFKSLYDFRRRYLKIRDVCMDFETQYFKVHSLVSKPMISCQTMTKILYGNFEKIFLKCENGFKKDLLAIPPHECFHIYFILLISDHLFSVNLKLICTVLWNFQEDEIVLAEAACVISASWITHSCKLIPNWTRNSMITYTGTNIWLTYMTETLVIAYLLFTLKLFCVFSNGFPVMIFSILILSSSSFFSLSW